MDFTSLTIGLDPTRLIQCLNEIISTFDKVSDNYDVFKVETKADASYMVVAGLKDRTHMVSSERKNSTVRNISIRISMYFFTCESSCL
jgi:hypothetical protein